MVFTSRYVALGDSFTEGMGDVDPSRPTQVRGWADRVALALSLEHDAGPQAFGYANLAVRGKKMNQILAEQIEPALALEPTLVTVYAGINDILRPKVSIDGMLANYGKALERLKDAGARVLVFTGFDASASKVFAGIRGRTATYNEVLREIADDLEVELIDYWRFSEYNDWRLWGVDRMHMSTHGHINMANRVLAAMGAQTRVEVPELPQIPPKSRLETARDNAAWTREYVGPWVGRRLRGVSSGDNLSARWPELHQPT